MILQRRHWRLALIVACALVLAGACALALAALAPLRAPTRDQLFEIPKGTWARRMAGHKVDILPSDIKLTLGVQDVLLLRNSDTVPQIFGPVLIMPGQDFRLPFAQVSDNQFACSAHTSGQMTVRVLAPPDAGLARLHWRWTQWRQHLPLLF